MASTPLRRPLKGAEKADPGRLTIAPLAPLGRLSADGQGLPIFATLDGAPVAVLPLDDYRRLVRAAMDGVTPARAPAPRAASTPAGRPVSTIERDSEVAGFLRELFGQRLTVAEIRAACIQRFGEARTPSATRITVFRQRTR